MAGDGYFDPYECPVDKCEPDCPSWKTCIYGEWLRKREGKSQLSVDEVSDG